METEALLIRGYRINRPELTTWNRLLLLRGKLKQVAVAELKETVDDIEHDTDLQQNVREWLQVSHRHKLSRREMFNYVKHLHESLQSANWKFVLHVYPVANMFSQHIMLRIEAGAITEQWFEWHVDKEKFDTFESMHVPVDPEPDLYNWVVWQEQMKLTPEPFRLQVIGDDLTEYATQCV